MSKGSKSGLMENTCSFLLVRLLPGTQYAGGVSYVNFYQIFKQIEEQSSKERSRCDLAAVADSFLSSGKTLQKTALDTVSSIL
jgi:hypothetical protein